MEDTMVAEGDSTDDVMLDAKCNINVKQNVFVEVCQKINSTIPRNIIKQQVIAYLSGYPNLSSNTKLTEFNHPMLRENVDSIFIDFGLMHSGKKEKLNMQTINLCINIFQLYFQEPGIEEIEDENMPAANHWLLPCSEFDGLWDSLIFDRDIKEQLLNYSLTTLRFSGCDVDTNIINWNKVVLLHGPPGTGKTSLCKALAQKLCIRLSDEYEIGQFIEINSHSLFSKWFSESGKLVMKMFQKIQDMISNPNTLVCVLIDEVESLTAARNMAMSGSDPSDAIRVVNALLTQLDQIKKYSNVLILTTSNVTGAIDLAFVDRADIKQYIGPPSVKAIFQIYQSCIYELMRVGIIKPKQHVINLHGLESARFTQNDATSYGLKLYNVSLKSVGLSGRALRKVPFIAHAVHVKTSSTNLDDFLDALSKAIEQQIEEQECLCKIK